MKIKELQISNVLSFQFFDEISNAPKISFDDSLNIFIGENGAGKSTVLEVINFIFKKVLFTQFNVNQDYYSRKSAITTAEKKQILSPANSQSFSGFRLEPNWETEDKPQKIRLALQLDDIDNENIKNLVDNREKLNPLALLYTPLTANQELVTQKDFVVEVTLNQTDKSFSVVISPAGSDHGYQYLVNYNFYKELINFYNFEHPDAPINPLYESFTLIGGYRNYYSFTTAVSLGGSTASNQMQKIRAAEYSRSTNSNEASEPSIFSLVRLRIAEKHYNLYGEHSIGVDSEKEANDQEFLAKINSRLKLVNLEAKIEFSDKQKWGYSFQFYDLKRKKPLNDINALSAGQKAIIHLVFEAYGRGDVKGGLVIIDEPEIHLHYQFQNEYLRVIEEINKEQNCQYVLVTHSESLVNSVTIHKIKRFALDKENHTVIKAPTLSADQKLLIKILDNTRSTYAFFAKKVLLVEGDTDRYFFKSVIQERHPELNQEIAVLDIGGKGGMNGWKEFFEGYGLGVYFIGDLDASFGILYPAETAYKLDSPAAVATFKSAHTDNSTKIEQKYAERIFILKDGDLEFYLDIHNKGLPETIKFCNEKLPAYLADEQNLKSKEIKIILDQVTI